MDTLNMPQEKYSRSLHDYLRILVKRRWTILAGFIGIVAVVGLKTFTDTPIYRATVQILIERQSPRLLEQMAPSSNYDYPNEEFYQTQYKLLESRALAKKVADKLKLKNHPNYAAFFRDLPPDADEAARQRAEERMLSDIARSMEVSPIRQSSLVNVRFSDPDPKFATTMVNTWAECYIEQSLDLRFAASQEAAVWLQGKLTEGRKKLEESEEKLNRYKREHNIVAQDDKESITAQKLEQLNKDLVAAQTHRMEAETHFKEVSQGNPISQVLNNPLIQTLKGQEAKILAEQSELSRKFGPEHPKMLQLANELSATRSKISAETDQVVQAIKNEYQMAKAQEENLKGALEAQKSETLNLSDLGIEYRVLLRDVETNRAMYENMLKNLKTTTATENVPFTNIRIVYPATVPTAPVSPRKVRNLGLAVVLGMVFGTGLALGIENMDTTLQTPEEVEGWLGIPNLAMIPHLKLSGNGNPGKELLELLVHSGSHNLASESYRGLRTSILFATQDHAPRTILITSSLPQEGKTMTACNLATAMAKAEPPVLLVDADLRRPTLHKLFQVPMEPGLCEFLVGDVNELPVVETEVPNLLVVPAGKIPSNPSELLHSSRMQELLKLGLEKFSRVVIDAPPLIPVTDSAILATMVEGVLLVVKAMGVPRKAAIQARDDLLEVNAHLLGTVFNNIPMELDKYGYYYYYYYSRYYRAHAYYTPEGDKQVRRHRRPQTKTGALGWVKDRVNNFKGKGSKEA